MADLEVEIRRLDGTGVGRPVAQISFDSSWSANEALEVLRAFLERELGRQVSLPQSKLVQEPLHTEASVSTSSRPAETLVAANPGIEAIFPEDETLNLLDKEAIGKRRVLMYGEMAVTANMMAALEALGRRKGAWMTPGDTRNLLLRDPRFVTQSPNISDAVRGIFRQVKAAGFIEGRKDGSRRLTQKGLDFVSRYRELVRSDESHK